MKKNESKKVFLYVDTEKEREIKTAFNKAAKGVEAIKTKLENFGIPVTMNILTGCFEMRPEKRTIQKPTNTIVNGNLVFNDCTVIIFANCELMDYEFSQIKENVLSHLYDKPSKDKKAKEMEEDYYTLQVEIYDIVSKIEFKYFDVLFDVKDGCITQKENADGIIKELSSVYATGDKAIAIMEAHENANKAINDFLSLCNPNIIGGVPIDNFFMICNCVSHSATMNYNILIK